MDMCDMWKLAHLLRQNGDRVLNDGSKLTLTASLLQKLNDAFLIIVDREDACGAFQVVSASGEPDELFHNLHFLHDFVQKVPALKVEQNLLSRVPLSRSCIVNVGKFRSLRYLELRKIPVHNVTGLQAVRPQLHAIVCVQCTQRLEDVLSACGGDQSSDFTWGELHEAVFSHNGIATLGSSLGLAPWLQVLDLSHNSLQTGDGLEQLPCLRYLNLGYNCLSSVPALSKEACAKIQILILKNNFIESAAVLAGLENLMELDLSWNIITGSESLWPLGDMSSLSVLCLDGNPLCFCPEYRTCIAATLHHNTAFNQHTLSCPLYLLLSGMVANALAVPRYCELDGSEPGLEFNVSGQNLPAGAQFVLDGAPLTKLEKLNLGKAVKEEQVYFPSHLPEKQKVSGVQQTSVASSSGRLQRGKKSSRVREVVISEQLGVDEEKVAPRASPTTSLDVSCEHLETKRQVEMLRERFGQEDWLHHLGGSCLQDVLGMERTAPPDLSTTLRQCLDTDDFTETTMNSPAQGDAAISVSVSDHQQSAASEATISATPAAKKVASEDSLQKALTSEAAADDDSQAESLQEPLEEESLDEADDDVADVKLYLVQKHRPGVDILDEMFLVITDMGVKERDMVSGKTREKWAMGTLLSCIKTSNDPVTLQLTFDTVRRDRQERSYIMDEEDAEQVLRSLGEILDGRSLAAMNQVVFRCLKCQSQFAQELGSHVTPHPDSQSVVCPACTSSVVIIMDEVPLPSSVSMVREELLQVAAVESGVAMMTKCPSECSIGLQSGTADTLEVTAVVHNPSSPADCAQPDASLSSATSLNQSPDQFQDVNPAMRRCESDIEIISNPSQSSIEVLDDSGRVRGCTPARKSSSEEKETTAVRSQLTSVKAMIMTESSSSGSLADSICTTYENLPGTEMSDANTLPAEGSLAEATRKATESGDSARVTSMSESSDDTLEGGEVKTVAVGSLPNVGVTYTSVLEDLLQTVTSRIPPVRDVQAARCEAGNGIRYSYSDFSDVDHRVKLHLYVHVFGDQEQLVLLLKARILRHHGEAPLMGCVVFSTSKIYLLQIIGPESDELQDWLRLEDSWPASSLKAVCLLPSEQGVGLELKSSSGAAAACSVLAVLQFSTYTTQFLEFLSGLSLPDKYSFSIGGTSDRHILQIQQLTLSMPTDDDPDLALHHFVIFSHCLLAELNPALDHRVGNPGPPRGGSQLFVNHHGENVKTLKVGVFVLTGSALLLTDDNVEWLFPGSSAVPEPAFTQSMSSLVELETEGLCLTFHFLEESTQSEESWIIAVDCSEMLDALASSAKSLWEDLFSVPLQFVDKNKCSD